MPRGKTTRASVTGRAPGPGAGRAARRRRASGQYQVKTRTVLEGATDMAAAQADLILRHVRRLAADLAPDLPDARLLERFAASGDEAAFAALVRRHGALVAGACRRILSDR